MNRIANALLDLQQLELMAEHDSSVHRLDPLTKTVVVAAFIICVVSFGRYEVSALIPYIIFPYVITARGGLSQSFILKKSLLFLPFIAMVGFFNPVFDRETVFQSGFISLSGGWISFFSLVTRSLLTIGSAFILVGTTGFIGVCQALRKIGLPSVFTTQLLFLHRYMFVLAEESARASHARELRSCGAKGLGIHSYSSLVGHLLLRTFGKAERIHNAMLSRGFNGEFHARHAAGPGAADYRFMIGWISIFILFRCINIPLLLGNVITGFLS